jgi:hypothetical protein
MLARHRSEAAGDTANQDCTLINFAHIEYRRAQTSDEFDAIHRLNYRAFVEEIPQHPPNPARQLVDRFHNENIYVIAKHAGDVIGMVSLRGARPFSLDEKLADVGTLESMLPPAQRICELRLLYVMPGARRSRVFYDLSRALFSEATAREFDLAIVSATLREARLYKHLGFVPFGPEVGHAQARYQPMWLDLERLTSAVPNLVAAIDRSE